MEDFESSASESPEWVASPEAIREKSEKQKESYKKAQAQIQRAQKDEKKAKWDNDELFNILTRFIQNPYYESLIPRLTELLSVAVPSRPILGMLALVYPDAAYLVLSTLWEGEKIHLLKTLHRYEESWKFHESDLDGSIRQWMTLWIDAFDRFIVQNESSVIMQKKFMSLIDSHETLILTSVTDIVSFFFHSRNIVIVPSTTESYARFILKNIRTTLQKSILSHPDSDIITVDESMIDMNLFGIK